MIQLTNGVLKSKIKEAVQHNKDTNGEKISLDKVKEKYKSTLCPVVELEVELLKLSPYSHRIKSQLEGDPSWHQLQNEPFSAPAQQLIARCIKEARSPEAFIELKTSLDRDGQTQPALITNEGVLINGNSRAVAMRELTGTSKKVIRVAVIEEELDEKDIALIEGRLQIQKEFKEEYSLTNTLLFIQYLADKGVDDRSIALELRLDPNPKKGAQEVKDRRSMLELLKEISRIPEDEIKLHQFDKDGSKVSYESLSVLLKKQKELESENPEKWQIYKNTWLLCVLHGYDTVHNLRNVDHEFFDEYVLPAVERDASLGPHFDGLPSKATEGELGESPLLKSLIDIAANKQNHVKILNSNVTFPKKDFKELVRESILAAAEEKKAELDDKNKKEKPVELIKAALRKLEKCDEYLKNNREYLDKNTREGFKSQFKRVKKKVENIEEILKNDVEN
jgi:hypothetical protein